MSRLNDMAPESEEVWMMGVPNKFLFRPQTREFEGMCLAEFASDYRVIYGRHAQRNSAIALRDNKGYIAKRTAGREAVIRFVRFSETKTPEKHFRRLLKLYLPHQSDHQLSDGGRTTYEDFYKFHPGVKRIVDNNKKRYEEKGAGMDKALKRVEEGPVLNAWNSFAPEVEVDRQECLNLQQTITEDNEEDAVPDFDVGLPAPRIEVPRLSPDFDRKMFQSVNETQACIFYAVRHSFLKLPRSLEPPYQGLGNALDELRASLSSVEILIIDEISMVSKKLFAYVNWRFQQLKGNRRPFGGVSILAVGDFYQLPPLGRAKPLCVYEDTEFDLWRDHFSIVNLTEIMRQKDDRAFAELLNRLRVKRKEDPLSLADRELLLQAVSNGKDLRGETLHVFATNKQVDSHNADTVSSLLEQQITIVAQDFRKDVTTGRKVPVQNVTGTKTDLPDSIVAGEGARIMLIRNVNVEDGLVNGTFGTIFTMVTENHDPKAVRLLGLRPDNPTAGQTLRKKLLGPTDDLVYIERSEESFGRKGRVVRCQFPIKLAFACTAHKVQGMTVTSAVVSLKRVFQPGMAYVALSRTTSLQGLTITDFDEKNIYVDPTITTALRDMRSASFQGVTPLLNFGKLTDRPRNTVTVIHHNTQGLPSHIVDLRVHHELRLADVLCLTETHLSGPPVSPSFHLEGYTMSERSRPESYDSGSDMAAKAGGGVAIYYKNTLTAEAPR
ncbi:uncharacterized protein LOC110967030 [Acanthochromis polyacanthus]|uniref:uncharacterized protein LOC110967030 n=1 Tax=Acanthochromis polyacanthus TaxID=80966 RepID=UPI002234A892|nr:uncharacterized protein LOC110967030 [Acanthochromis polyacanthus]